jgi:putative ATP-binding cassette transporter
MKLISFLLRSSPAVVIIAILAGLIAGISNTGLLILINATLNHRDGVPASRLVWYFVGLCCVMLVARSASTILLIRLSRWAIFDLRMKLCRQILAAPLRHLEELGGARLLAALTDDVPALATALTNIPVMCMHCAVVLTCLVYLCWLSRPVFLGVLFFMVVGIASYQLPIWRAHYHLRASRREWDALFRHFRSLTEGAKELKLHHQRRRTFLSDQLEPTAQALRHHGFIGDASYAVANSWGQLLIFMLIGTVLYGLPLLRSVDATTLTGYSLVILYIMTPLEYIMNTLPVFGRANVALQQVGALGLSLKEKSIENLPSVPIEQPAGYRSLELMGVTHSYYREDKDKEENFLLGPINAAFHPGELVFLVGGNGSGKTTFAKLLAGLYYPEVGEIHLDGHVITDENREQYRQLFSVVFSDFYLFEQLLGFETDGLDSKSRQYLTKLQLDHKVRVQEGVLSTTDLSQGQRKRLALMTAYLEDRPFYIFDEWAADQDPLFKEIFYLQLLPELKAKGKTVLAISHDDRYYHVADRVIKLDYGKVEQDHRISHAEPVLPLLE